MKKRVFKNIDENKFKEIYLSSKSYAEVCRKLSLRPQGSNYRIIKKLAKKLNLPKINFDFKLQGKKLSQCNKIPLSDILIKNSIYGSSSLRRRLIKEKILKNECQKCRLKNLWQNEPITLHLDHINGDHTDNRLENLRILCPNCHSQTLTHSGKKLKQKYICPNCNCEYPGYGKTCSKCRKIKQNYKIIWPEIDWILNQLLIKSYTILAKDLGVSDNAIRRYLKSKNVIPPKKYSKMAGKVACDSTTSTFSK